MFPTRVRTFGLGVNNAMSRIGALVSPFLAVDLVERGSPGIAEGTLALACLAAAVACALLPLETSGKELAVGERCLSHHVQFEAFWIDTLCLQREAEFSTIWRSQ